MRYAILQLREGENFDFAWMGLEMMEEKGHTVDLKNYEIIHCCHKENMVQFDNEEEVYKFLEDLFFMCNLKHPTEYYGCSMSVGDIIVLEQGYIIKYYYCDSFGFEELKLVKNCEVEKKILNNIDVFTEWQTTEDIERKKILEEYVKIFKFKGVI